MPELLEKITLGGVVEFLKKDRIFVGQAPGDEIKPYFFLERELKIDPLKLGGTVKPRIVVETTQLRIAPPEPIRDNGEWERWALNVLQRLDPTKQSLTQQPSVHYFAGPNRPSNINMVSIPSEGIAETLWTVSASGRAKINIANQEALARFEPGSTSADFELITEYLRDIGLVYYPDQILAEMFIDFERAGGYKIEADKPLSVLRHGIKGDLYQDWLARKNVREIYLGRKGREESGRRGQRRK